MTVVYIDSVLVLNTLMDYLLLTATARLAGVPLHRGRYLLAAALGGIYAVAVFLPGWGVLAQLPGKLAAGALMAGVAYGGQGKLLRLTLLLAAVSCGFAGCVLGIGLLSGSRVPMENGIFYTNVDTESLLIAAAAAYLLVSVVFRAAARHGVGGMLTPVTLALGGRHIQLTALCDTGNDLQDPATGRPVLVAEGSRLASLWPPELRSVLTAERLRTPSSVLEMLPQRETRFRLIPYRSVGVPGGLLLAVRTDWGEIGGRHYDHLLVALSPTELGNGFTALWGELERRRQSETLENPAAASAGACGAGSEGEPALHRRK